MDADGGDPSYAPPAAPIADDEAHDSLILDGFQPDRIRKRQRGQQVYPRPCIATEADLL
jgi:hypothetical protein